ncbi:helix-turn-helix domain-containing protein [Flavobacterium sp.]|uniref:helix-turn-helix domain-containing protein n=1 Tax=Flavobacterium sp. TaxID=239 RepID=UPI002488E75E|nr:helix-turn-helix domain-containing protein [Flavobacterium sp.]MDI1315964.1 helix-turn-helix domain-containing protein [Flavobacterium sp.]
MPFNLYVFSIGSFMFLSFSLHLLITKFGNTYLNKLLALLMLFRGLQMVYFINNTSDQSVFVSSLFTVLLLFSFAHPVCTYLYFRGYIADESRFQRKDWIHFLPFALVALVSLISFFTDTFKSNNPISSFIPQKIHSIFLNKGVLLSEYVLLLRNVLSLLYLFFIWGIVLKAKIIKNRRANLVSNNWILLLLFFVTCTSAIFIFNTFIIIANGTAASNLFMNTKGSVILCVLVIFLIGFVFYNPKTLYGYVFLSKGYVPTNKNNNAQPLENENAVMPIAIPFFDPDQTKTSVKFTDDEQFYLEQITTHMEAKQSYLNPDYSITLLCQETGIPVHHCSYIMNYCIGKNFREWINSYRIAYFIEHYQNNSTIKTILALSMESGFKNKVTFYSAFKNEKGVLPSDYFSS